MIFNQLIETIQNELLFFFQKNMHEKNGEELNGELVIDIIKSNGDERIMFVKFDDAQFKR